MQTLADIRVKQSAFTAESMAKAEAYVASLDKEGLVAILLSGSLARGDFFPGELGGMVDLVVLTEGKYDVEPVFSVNEEPDIPYHCLQREGQGYQILFLDFEAFREFKSLEEARKYALLESRILWESAGLAKAALQGIASIAKAEQAGLAASCKGYTGYLLGDYKQDRWARREAWPQLHANLDTALQLALRRLYYLNGLYAPAEDRRLYYSFSLPLLPRDYPALMETLSRHELFSGADYRRRAALFSTMQAEIEILAQRPQS